MGRLKTTNESLIGFNSDYIVHQCNCVSTIAKGLAYDIFRKYPYSNVYENRELPDEPGTIKVTKNIIALFGQYYPGGPLHDQDLENDRESFFLRGLNEIEKLEFNSIAFPYKIGCGLAAGYWPNYFNMIEKFSERVNGDIYICKL